MSQGTKNAKYGQLKSSIKDEIRDAFRKELREELRFELIDEIRIDLESRLSGIEDESRYRKGESIRIDHEQE